MGKMRFFVIGDVHGCYYTFRALLREWNQESEMLVQLGDLIDRGKNSPQMVALARTLSEENPTGVRFLKGNHEYEMQQHFFNGPNANWLRQGGAGTIKQYENEKRDGKNDVEWLSRLPLFFESRHLYISHAGISEAARDPFVEGNEYGILWNRSRLKNIGKMQVIGHTPGEEPLYDSWANAWNIDTGAVYGRYLTGVKISEEGEVLEFLRVETDARDL
jgi:serine/threonine protein phosphatase 1